MMNALLSFFAFVHLSFCPEFLLASSMRQTVVSWDAVGSDLTDRLGTTFRFVSQIQCVKMGLENPSVLCLFYWSRDRTCILSADLPNREPNGIKSTVSYAELRQTDDRLDKARSGFVSFVEIGLSLMYHNVSKPIRVGDSICKGNSSTLLRIDNHKKQEIAARLLKRSDQQLLFAGVYKRALVEWLYYDGTPVKYTNWAYKEPKLPTFAAVSKADDNKWVTVGDQDSAGWICQKPMG